MANSPQAIKRVRQNTTRREQQQSQVSAMRTAIKNAKIAIENGNENAEELVNAAIKAIDKASSKNLIHENKAARDKSKLQKLFNNR